MHRGIANSALVEILFAEFIRFRKQKLKLVRDGDEVTMYNNVAPLTTM